MISSLPTLPQVEAWSLLREESWSPPERPQSRCGTATGGSTLIIRAEGFGELVKTPTPREHTMADRTPATARERHLAWMREGTAAFTARLTDLTDADFDAPSRLPDWTRRHVVAHVGYNARGLMRLLHWARTGEETPMYASGEAREAEIEDGARLSPTELRELALATATELEVAFDSLSDEQWGAEVVARHGQAVRATAIPWLRCREIWIHTVDLAAGTEFADFPPEVVDALLTDLTGARQRNEQEPALLLAPEDRQRTWTIELADQPTATITGPAASMAAWLTGRDHQDIRQTDAGTPLPSLGRWL
jgi:maleylpyruvate isomerase